MDDGVTDEEVDDHAVLALAGTSSSTVASSRLAGAILGAVQHGRRLNQLGRFNRVPLARLALTTSQMSYSLGASSHIWLSSGYSNAYSELRGYHASAGQ